jgi:hypothetical protein
LLANRLKQLEKAAFLRIRWRFSPLKRTRVEESLWIGVMIRKRPRNGLPEDIAQGDIESLSA